jgi:hypothetical protein
MAGQLGGGGGGSIKDLVDLKSFFEKNAKAQIAQDVSAVSQEEHVKQKIYTYWDKIQTSWHNYQHDPQMMLILIWLR